MTDEILDARARRIAYLAADMAEIEAEARVLATQPPIVREAVYPGLRKRFDADRAELIGIKKQNIEDARGILDAAAEHAKLQGLPSVDLDLGSWPIPAAAVRRFFTEVLGKEPDA